MPMSDNKKGWKCLTRRPHRKVRIKMNANAMYISMVMFVMGLIIFFKSCQNLIVLFVKEYVLFMQYF